MKKKVFAKKLSLEKETIAALNTRELFGIMGGKETLGGSCPTLGCQNTCYPCPETEQNGTETDCCS